MIIGSDFQRVGYSWKTKDDWFWEVPIEDDGSFVIGRNMPVDTRDLVHPNMAPRIDRTKSKVSNYLNFIKERTISIRYKLQDTVNIQNLKISPCNSKITFSILEEEMKLELTWFSEYTINDNEKISSMHDQYSERLFESIYIVAIKWAFKRIKPDYIIQESYKGIMIEFLDNQKKKRRYTFKLGRKDYIECWDNNTRYSNDYSMIKEYWIAEFLTELYNWTLIMLR